MIIGAALYLGSAPGQRMVRNRINGAIPGEIAWDGLRISPFGGRLELTGAVVSGPDGAKIISADRLFLNISTAALARGVISIETAELDRPRVWLERYESGDLNLARAFTEARAEGEASKETQEKDGFFDDVVVDDFHLTDGFFQYRMDPGNGQKNQITLGNIDFSIRDGHLNEKTGRIRLSMGNGEIEMGGVHTRLERFRVETALQDGRLTPLEVDIQTDGPSLQVSGDVNRLFAEPEVDLRLDLDLDLADLNPMLQLDNGLSGPLQLTLTAFGPSQNPKAILSVTYGGGELAGIPVDQVDVESRLEDRVVAIEKLALASVLGKITGEGAIDLRKAFPNGLLSAPTDMDALSYQLGLKGTGTALNRLPWTEDVLAGDIRTRIDLEGSGISSQTLTARADLDLSSENFAVQDVLSPIPVKLTGKADFADGAITLTPLDLNTRETLIRLNGDYDLSANALDMNLRVKTPVLAQILTPLQVPGFSGKATLSADVSGPVAQPAVDTHLQSENVRFEDIAIGDVSLNAVLQKSGLLDIAGLTVQNQGSHLTLSGSLRLFDNGFAHFNPAMPAELNIAFQDLEARDFVETIDFQGSLAGNLDLSGRLLAPSADLSLSGDELAWGDTRIGDLNTDLTLADGTLHLKTARLVNRRSQAAVSGTAQLFNPETMTPLENPTFDLELDRSTVFLSDFMNAASGELFLSARAEGSLQAPTATLAVRGKNLSAADTRIGNLEADLALARGLLTIRELALRNQQSALRISGTAQLLDSDTLQPLENPAFDIAIEEGAVHLADFRKDLQGTLTLQGGARGDLKGPAARVMLQGDDLAAQGRPIGDLKAELRFADGRLRLTPFSLENGDSNLNITATAQLLDPKTLTPLKDPEFDLQVTDGALYLQDFIEGMTGRLALKGDLGGSFNHPQGTIALAGEQLDLGVQKLDEVQLESRLDGEKVHMEPFLIAMAPGENIRTDGWISFQKRYDLRTHTDGVSLNRIGPLEDQEFGNGKIAFNIAGEGSFKKPRLDGEITLFGVRINEQSLEELKLEMEIQDQVARITGNLNFDLNAEYHLESREFSLTALFKETDLTPYFRLAGRDEMTGRITGKLEATGNAAAPEKIRASTDLPRLSISMKGRELMQTRDFRASFEEGRITLPENRLVLLEDGYLDLQGSGSLDGGLSLAAQGNIPVRVAEAFAPDLTGFTGDVGLSARLEGSLEKPDLEADIVLKQIGLTVPELMQKLHDLNGRIEITQEAVTLNEIEGKLDDGRFRLAGNIELKDFQPGRAQVEFSARTLPIEVPDTLNLLLNTDLTLEGAPDKSRLSGEVVLLDGLYYKDVKLNLLQKIGDIGQRTRQTSAPRETEPIEAPYLKNLALDITVQSRNPLMVDNNVALLSLKPALRIQGGLNRPRVSGRAEIAEGTISYQNTEFDVKKGVVDFVNPYRIEPTIDVAAVSDVRKWTITLHISGAPDNLNFKLSSDPPEEDADILSLLALGKTTRELVQGDGGGSRSPKELLAGIVSNRFQEDIKKSTGLDVEFDYKEGENGKTGEADEEDEIRVTVGKELSRRVTVKYGVERRGGETVQKATTEYKLLENLLMSAFQDTEGDFGGELQFRLEFR
ncbi:MAG: translocation/assembly module TamB domain-containing protein [Desulfococcaceae bacterium]